MLRDGAGEEGKKEKGNRRKDGGGGGGGKEGRVGEMATEVHCLEAGGRLRVDG